ncbi:hypothetical protein P4O66_001181 [Electrophorus voltai]|uniref:Uncharacterized protein n=1 Tax=Electrophorus voltai TaxID=2609070 RepID=A0AAD9DVP4_9TELE|nr:hypothetical protein P4O66_001181 [Electrophorus voltai]
MPISSVQTPIKKWKMRDSAETKPRHDANTGLDVLIDDKASKMIPENVLVPPVDELMLPYPSRTSNHSNGCRNSSPMTETNRTPGVQGRLLHGREVGVRLGMGWRPALAWRWQQTSCACSCSLRGTGSASQPPVLLCVKRTDNEGERSGRRDDGKIAPGPGLLRACSGFFTCRREEENCHRTPLLLYTCTPFLDWEWRKEVERENREVGAGVCLDSTALNRNIAVILMLGLIPRIPQDCLMSEGAAARSGTYTAKELHMLTSYVLFK